MNQLKDFRNDPESIASTSPKTDAEEAELEASSSHYQQEINTLKIEKLANRVTIISVILPVLIGAIVFFAYLDMKERMVDSNMSKQTQVEHLKTQVGEKINALDMRVGKNRLDIDKELPAMKKRRQALENQLAKMESSRAKLKDLAALKLLLSKADKRLKTVEAGIKKASDKSIANAAQLGTVNAALTAKLIETEKEVERSASGLKEDMGLFKEEFDARLLVLNAYEERITQLNQQIALMDKKIRTLTRELEDRKSTQARITRLEADIRELTLQLKTMGQSKSVAKPKPKPAAKPVPQLIGPQTAPPSKNGISQGDLTQ